MSHPLGAQDALVAVLAGIALSWLVARRWRAAKRPSCEDCPGCSPRVRPAGASPAPPDTSGAFVPLDALRRHD
jgi:hypothetical protein